MSRNFRCPVDITTSGRRDWKVRGATAIVELNTDAAAFHRTQRTSINLMWNPVPFVDIVVEFLAGTRVNKNGQRASSVRFRVAGRSSSDAVQVSRLTTSLEGQRRA